MEASTMYAAVQNDRHKLKSILQVCAKDSRECFRKFAKKTFLPVPRDWDTAERMLEQINTGDIDALINSINIGGVLYLAKDVCKARWFAHEYPQAAAEVARLLNPDVSSD